MSSLMETGFVSAEQEAYLMKNESELYKAVLKKHGHFGKKKNNNLMMGKSSAPDFSSRFKRGVK